MILVVGGRSKVGSALIAELAAKGRGGSGAGPLGEATGLFPDCVQDVQHVTENVPVESDAHPRSTRPARPPEPPDHRHPNLSPGTLKPSPLPTESDSTA